MEGHPDRRDRVGKADPGLPPGWREGLTTDVRIGGMLLRAGVMAIAVVLAGVPASTEDAFAQDDTIAAVGVDVVEPACPQDASADAGPPSCSRATPTIPPDWVSTEAPGDVSPICMLAFARASDGRAADLSGAIRTCASFDEWTTAARTYPDASAGSDPLQLALEMCADETMGLAGYATCDSLQRMLANRALITVPAMTPDEQRYCQLVAEFDRQRRSNVELQVQLYEPAVVRGLPSRSVARTLAAAARSSRMVADRLERLTDLPAVRESVRLRAELLRVEATMLRQYRKFARKPTLANRERAEKARARRQSAGSRLTAALAGRHRPGRSIAC